MQDLYKGKTTGTLLSARIGETALFGGTTGIGLDFVSPFDPIDFKNGIGFHTVAGLFSVKT